MTLGDTVF